MKQKRKTKYTYGQFAKINGKRYRVRKHHYVMCKGCALNEDGRGRCAIGAAKCLDLIPVDASLEKV